MFYTNLLSRFLPIAILLVSVLLRSAGADIIPNKNCGLSCVFSTLRLFGIDCDYAELAKSMDVGESRERECSFTQLQSVLSSYGLSVAGYRADSVSEMLESIPLGAVGIIRTKSVDREYSVAHFMLAVPSTGQMMIIDPTSLQLHSLKLADTASTRLLPDATGEFIVVTHASSAEPFLCLLNKHPDLGEISAEQALVEATLFLRNAGAKQLLLTDIKSACGCVERIDSPKELAPGTFGEIKVYFRRNMLPVGEIIRQVFISTNDPTQPSVAVPVKLNIKSAMSEDEIRLSPRALSYGRVQANEIAQRTERIKLTIPRDGDVRASKVSVRSLADDIKLVLIEDRPVETSGEDAPGRCLLYELRWKSPPVGGRFERRIEISIYRPGKTLAVLSLGIRGDALGPIGLEH